MQPEITGVEQIILLIFCGFIIAINLSLVFAFVRRNRDANREIQSPFGRTRQPWHSKYEDESAELSRIAGELRKNAEDQKPAEDQENRDHSS